MSDVVGSTVTEFKRHPIWIVGGVVGLIILFFLLSGSKKTAATPQNFTFTSGPSDAQIQAGTALAIQQAADQTQVSLAGINATTNTADTQTYVGYLSNNSANALAASVNTNSAAVTENTTNNQTAIAENNNALKATISGQAYATQTAQINATAATTINASNNQTTAYVTASNNVTADHIAATNAGSANYQAGLASYTATFDAVQAANTSYNNDVAMTAIYGKT